MVVRNIGFAAQQTWDQSSALSLCSTMTLGKSRLFESQFDHPQHGVTTDRDVGKILGEYPCKMGAIKSGTF